MAKIRLLEQTRTLATAAYDKETAEIEMAKIEALRKQAAAQTSTNGSATDADPTSPMLDQASTNAYTSPTNDYNDNGSYSNDHNDFGINHNEQLRFDHFQNNDVTPYINDSGFRNDVDEATSPHHRNPATADPSWNSNDRYANDIDRYVNNADGYAYNHDYASTNGGYVNNPSGYGNSNGYAYNHDCANTNGGYVYNPDSYANTNDGYSSHDGYSNNFNSYSNSGEHNNISNQAQGGFPSYPNTNIYAAGNAAWVEDGAMDMAHGGEGSGCGGGWGNRDVYD